MRNIILTFTVICNISIISKTGYINAQNIQLASYESYFLKTGVYPEDNTNIWMLNGLEVQGVTNDGDNWYFTLTSKDESDAYLWRIPKQYDLNKVKLSDEGVGFINLNNTTLPHKFWHWGDPDHFAYDSDNDGIKEDYILVPIPGAIACFRADDLLFINYTNFDDQDYVGWCAIGVDNKLYSSNENATEIKQYSVDWNKLINTRENSNLLSFNKSFKLQFSNNNYFELRHMQGGEFTDSGELLYLVSGSAGCNVLGIQIKAEPEASDGIHVFRTDSENWTEIAYSLNSNTLESYFSYTFDNNCGCGVLGSQSPEGLTIWNLEDGSAPNIRGSLHVLVDHYNLSWAPCDDAVSFQHFSNRLYVDLNKGVSPPFPPTSGSTTWPFKYFNHAFFTYPAWPGSEIILKAGNDPSKGIYNQRIIIKSDNGPAIIGKQ